MKSNTPSQHSTALVCHSSVPNLYLFTDRKVVLGILATACCSTTLRGPCSLVIRNDAESCEYSRNMS